MRADRAHPRVCGENSSDRSRQSLVLGSSPRVRGKRYEPEGGLVRTGLIPACAGKTAATADRFRCRGAHPRVCGENSIIATAMRQLSGSSPRVRGKLGRQISCMRKQGLIPACAGKTNQPTNTSTLPRAHPRVCGENAERSGVLTLRSVRSWKTLSFPSSLKVTDCRTFVQLSLSSIRL